MSRVYWMESKMELRKMARLKQYSLSTVAFPLMFYIFFGLVMGSSSLGGVTISRYALATYGAFGVMGATLYAFGAGERHGRPMQLAGGGIQTVGKGGKQGEPPRLGYGQL